MVILRQIFWLNPVATPDFSKSGDGPAMMRQSIEFLQHRDWNNRRESTSPGYFSADVPSDSFMSENTRANDIRKQAPSWFLLQAESQPETMKERSSTRSLFTRNRFKIRRDHILEDAFSELTALAEEDLRGVIAERALFL